MPLTSFSRLLASVLLLAAGGCSSDAIYGPQTFFPGGNRHSWSDCDKFGIGNADVQICAGYTYLSGGINLTPQSYEGLYYIASDQHVRLAVFDSRGAPVQTLFDQDETAGSHPIKWRFFDDAGRPVVPSGDYRLYFRAGDFVSSSDVTVP